MLTHPTLDQLHQLGLLGMAKAFGDVETSGKAAALTHPEGPSLLLNPDMTYRPHNKLAPQPRYPTLHPRVWGRASAHASPPHPRQGLPETRYGRRSPITPSHLPVESCHAVPGDPTHPAAILARIVPNAQRLNLSGDSLRRTRSKSSN